MSSRLTNHNFYEVNASPVVKSQGTVYQGSNIRKHTYLTNTRNSSINFQQDFDSLQIIIPSAGFFSKISFDSLLKITIFTFILFSLEYLKNNLIVSNLIVQLLNLILSIAIAFVLLCLSILLFRLLLNIFGKMKLSIDRQKFTITYNLFGIKNHRSQIISLKDIIRLEKHNLLDRTNSYLEIITHKENHLISSNPHFLVTSSEIDLIGDTISNWLKISLTEITDLTSEELKKAICDVQQLSDTN